jgi:serine/threonine protein kinase
MANIPRSFSVGELVLNRFKITRPLGSGGMGEVYEAQDLELGRIALKIIRSDIAAHYEILSRFKTEVQLARKVGNPHVCRVHELFALPASQADPPTFFLTMEFLEGVTLSEKVRLEGPQPWRRARAIGVEICTGLQAIHQAGIVHRDLKSGNIMLVPRNGTTCAVVMDFGLARGSTSGTSETVTYATGPGAIAGTPAYMAPEQFEGAEVTPATDIYALGVVLYELVTGKLPFASGNPVGAAVSRGKHPLRASSVRLGVPHHFDDVIEKCLRYEAEERYQSADEVASSLNAHPLSFRRLLDRRPVVLRSKGVLAIAVSVLVLTLLGSLLWFRAHRYHPPSREVQRWYDAGLAALREGTYLKATRALQVAVDNDKNFALGHARLADAWSELDFAGRAQNEMLLASAPESDANLPAQDRMYIEAIRSTLTHEFLTAANKYRAILDALPEQEKAFGYVDLGRAQEKAGNFDEAAKDFELASQQDRDDPAAFVRLGILRNRQQDVSGGESAFKRAEALYQNSSNEEGLAEIAYQRGYAENIRGDSAHAMSSLQKSLAIARQIPSAQLEIRALTQMSNVNYEKGNSSEAIENASQAIKLARENQLEYWTGDGLMRLGNAYLSNHELDKAEDSLQSSLALAQQLHQPRLEANANLSLASVRDQERRWDESISFAQAALKYYEGAGMTNNAISASILIVREQQNNRDLTAALESAKQLLHVSQKSVNPALTEISEELMGDILSGLERYPESLSHFQESLRIARSIRENEPYQALHCADVLWILGRFDEAREMLGVALTVEDPGIISEAELDRANILMAQQKFAQVISLTNRALQPRGSNASPDDLPQFQLLRARAELFLGQNRAAADDVRKLLQLNQKEDDEEAESHIKVVQAEVYRRSGSPLIAEPLVDSACHYFLRSGKQESQWLSVLEQARVYRASGKLQESKASAKVALDILNTFEQTWPPADYSSYTKRPDIHTAWRELVTLGQN